MIVGQIGYVAGDIYGYLVRTREASLNDIKKELGQTPAMVQLGVGWLAREGKIEVNKKGAGYQVRLVG